MEFADAHRGEVPLRDGEQRPSPVHQMPARLDAPGQGEPWVTCQVDRVQDLVAQVDGAAHRRVDDFRPGGEVRIQRHLAYTRGPGVFPGVCVLAEAS